MSGNFVLPLSRSNPLSPRTFLSGMLGALVAALLVIVAMVLLGEYTKTRGRLLLTFLVLAPNATRKVERLFMVNHVIRVTRITRVVHFLALT